MSFDGIVRPFQRADLSPVTPALPAVTNTGTTAPIIKRFGQAGDVKQTTGSLSIQVTYYVVHRPEEQDGETTQSEAPL